MCRARVALNVNKFLHYHTLPTEMLIQVYEANAEHDSMHADSSGEDISATRRLVSDQQHMLVTVLQIRADAAAKSSSKSRSSSIDEQVDAQLASKFVSELGTVAFGSPPPSLNLPADERLIAIARCRSGGAFGTLVSSQFCLLPGSFDFADVNVVPCRSTFAHLMSALSPSSTHKETASTYGGSDLQI